MRLVRYRSGDGIAAGFVEDGIIHPIRGTFFEDPVPTGDAMALDEVRLLSPVLPSKVLAVGKNYAEHAEEFGGDVPEEPLLFMKPSTSVIGHHDPIPLPALSERVDHEGELALVIGRLARRVPIEEAGRYVLGYTCANDVTARDLQARDGQWTRAKGFDGFCPLGPWIETEVDPMDLAIECRVNGETRQSARTSQLTFGPAELVAYASAVMTLLPGDVLLTGTPAGVGPLLPGDVVEVEIEAIGTLQNTAVRADG
jgi:2-keto-4-pentenoate hydratase/2-oxohepta-3-ene-1,7-dioic acid hydratase in catechol pathway